LPPYRNRDEAVYVEGITDLRRALRRVEGNSDKRLRSELAGIGQKVRGLAQAYAPVGPRPKRSYTKPLRSSICVR